MPYIEEQHAASIREFAQGYVSEHVDQWTWEVNLTTLAEEVAHELDHDEWLDDPDHILWEIVAEVADEHT